MSKKTNPIEIHQNDIFEENYKEFLASSLCERLTKKTQILPYWKKYKLLYHITFSSSFLLNVVSALGASILIYYFFKETLGLWWAALMIAVISVILVEFGKRTISKIVFWDKLQFKKTRYVLGIILLLIMSGSVVSTYFGVKKMVFEWTPDVDLVAADTSSEVTSILASLDQKYKQKKEYNTSDKYKNANGEIYYNIVQNTIPILEADISALELRLTSIRSKYETKNDDKSIKHEEYVKAKAESIALVSILLEILFVICAFNNQYYDYRSIAEFSKVAANKSKGSSGKGASSARKSAKAASRASSLASDASIPQGSAKGVATKDKRIEILQLAEKRAKGNYDAYKSKYKKNPSDSNRNGMERWKSKLQEIAIQTRALQKGLASDPNLQVAK